MKGKRNKMKMITSISSLVFFLLIVASVVTKFKPGYQVGTSFFFYLLMFRLSKVICRKSRREDNVLAAEEHYFKGDIWVAWAGYAALTALVFSPCLKHLTSFLIGPPEDNMQHFWDLWWMQKVASGQGVTLQYTNHIYYPEGTSLLFHTFSFYNLFLSVGLNRFLDLVLTYNLLVLSTFLLSGIGGFLLVRHVTRDSWAALVGGFIFAFNHFHFAHGLHHLEITSLHFIPFYVLFVLKAVKRNSKSDLFWAAVFFLLNALCSWYYFNFAFVFLVLSYLYLAWQRRQLFLKDVAVKSGLIIAPTLLAFLPRAVAAVALSTRHPAEVFLAGHNKFVVDLASLLVPDPYHWLAGQPMVYKINALIPLWEWEKTAYLGISCFLILVFALMRKCVIPRKYLLGFLAFLILSMGMTLHVAGRVIPVILPGAVARYLPLFKYARTMSVFLAYVYLYWAILVAFGLKSIVSSQRSAITRSLITLVCFIFIFIDYFAICHDMTPVAAPRCYAAIPRSDERFGILNLPLRIDDYYMLYQTRHDFPIVAGYVGRRIGRTLRNRLEWDDLQKQKSQLTDSRVKYIVIHRKFVKQTPKFFVNIPEYQKHYPTVYSDEDQLLLQVY